jgi:hypothetical protein
VLLNRAVLDLGSTVAMVAAPSQLRAEGVIVAGLALLLAITLSHAAQGKQPRATNHATRLGMKKLPVKETGS